MGKSLNFKNIRDDMNYYWEIGTKNGKYDEYNEFYRHLNFLYRLNYISHDLWVKIYEYDHKIFVGG